MSILLRGSEGNTIDTVSGPLAVDMEALEAFRKDGTDASERPHALDHGSLRSTLDITKLDVCFGGFTPMALSDGPASTSQVELARLRAKQREESRRQAEVLAKARESAPADHVDGHGITWHYVVLDETSIRIDHCVVPEQLSDLIIPEEIQGLPVVALAADACARLQPVRSIFIPDSIVSIGNCAFRECALLESIRFPCTLSEYDPQWVRRCDKLHTLTLPGQLEKLTSKIFDSPNLAVLIIGAAAQEVMPGAFLKSRLERVEIDEENTVLITDGHGIYQRDPMVLLALATPCQGYEVMDGCTALAKKALSSFESLESVELPSSVEIVGDFSFTKTGILRFRAPTGLRVIGERAFFACTHLAEVELNEGLLAIGDNAFTETDLRSLRIPASVQELGNPIAARTDIIYAGEDATFMIEDGSPNLVLDERGGLYAPAEGEVFKKLVPERYANRESGFILIRMMDPDIEEYTVKADTIGIAKDAFAKHAAIRRVELPRSLEYIGEAAFKGCTALEEAVLPPQLKSIGEEAFLDTGLRSIGIPHTLERLGSLAIITHGAHHGNVEPSLQDITVEEGNARFRMHGSLLLERMDNGHDRVIVCTGTDPDVRIPETVNAIAPYAFNGLRRLKSLALSDAITMVEVRGLGFDCLLDHVHVDLVEPVEGHESFDIDLPQTARAAQQMMLAFNSSPFVNVMDIMEHYDNSVVNASGFDAATEKGLEAYEQVTRILSRLQDSVYMTPANRNLADHVLKDHLLDFCLEIARHDDKALMDELLDMGYLNEGNIDEVIERVGAVQDASITNHLLEAKRKLVGVVPVDFEADFAL